MKTLKIYGVYDLMEWRAVVPCKNGTKLHILFEGGSATSNGIIPAKYRTDNEVVQALIESSDLYKRGKIRLVRTISSHAQNMKTKSAEKKTAPAPEKSSATEKKVVKVSDIEGEGRKYLIDNYGTKPQLLNGVNAIIAQADGLGIKFVTE